MLVVLGLLLGEPGVALEHGVSHLVRLFRRDHLSAVPASAVLRVVLIVTAASRALPNLTIVALGEAIRLDHGLVHGRRAVTATQELAVGDKEAAFNPEVDCLLTDVRSTISRVDQLFIAAERFSEDRQRVLLPLNVVQPLHLLVVDKLVVDVDDILDLDGDHWVTRHHRRLKELGDQQIVEGYRLVLILLEEGLVYLLPEVLAVSLPARHLVVAPPPDESLVERLLVFQQVMVLSRQVASHETGNLGE